MFTRLVNFQRAQNVGRLICLPCSAEIKWLLLGLLRDCVGELMSSVCHCFLFALYASLTIAYAPSLFRMPIYDSSKGARKEVL